MTSLSVIQYVTCVTAQRYESSYCQAAERRLKEAEERQQIQTVHVMTVLLTIITACHCKRDSTNILTSTIPECYAGFN